MPILGNYSTVASTRPPETVVRGANVNLADYDYNVIFTKENLFFEEYQETAFFSDTAYGVQKQNFDGYEISSSEPYRQGVEIRSARVYASAIIRIHSGESGHRSKKLNYGQDDSNEAGDLPVFFDEENEDNVKHQLLDPAGVPFRQRGEAMATYEHGQLKNVIEPLSIRPAATFMSPYFPFEPNSFWGNLCGGNLGYDRSTDLVVSRVERKNAGPTPYFDEYEISTTVSLPGKGINLGDGAQLNPFVDEEYGNKIIKGLSGSITIVASKINYEDDFVTHDTVSCTSGYQYEYSDSVHGTDSIAFGGLRYA